VLIGRSSKMSDEQRTHRKVTSFSLNAIKVMTFDRLLKFWEGSE